MFKENKLINFVVNVIYIIVFLIIIYFLFNKIALCEDEESMKVKKQRDFWLRIILMILGLIWLFVFIKIFIDIIDKIVIEQKSKIHMPSEFGGDEFGGIPINQDYNVLQTEIDNLDILHNISFPKSEVEGSTVGSVKDMDISKFIDEKFIMDICSGDFDKVFYTLQKGFFEIKGEWLEMDKIKNMYKGLINGIIDQINKQNE